LFPGAENFFPDLRILPPVYPAMPRLLVCLAFATLLLAAGCQTARPPTTATRLEPPIQAKVDRGIVEPGFTPEMVFLALGKPTEPASSLADATTDGKWIYREFQPKNERGLLRPGQRTHVVADNAGKEKIVTEPLASDTAPNLAANSMEITFRAGRVVEIQRR
jgi:hypothetical protein